MNILLGILILIGMVICYAIGAAVLGALGMGLIGSFWRVLFTPVIVGFVAIAIPIAMIVLLFKGVFILLGWLLCLLLAALPFILVIYIIIKLVKKSRKRH